MSRAAFLACLVVAWCTGCHDFEAEYGACVDAGRCEGPDAGAPSDAGALPDGGGDDGGGDDGGATDAGSDAGFVVRSPALCLDGLCWESPRPGAFAVNDVVAVSPTEAWFVGERGVVSHVTGETVESFTLGTSSLTSVAAEGTEVIATAQSALWNVGGRVSTLTVLADQLTVIHSVGDGGFVVGGASGGVGALYALGGDLALSEVRSLGSGRRAVSLTGRLGALACSTSDGVAGELHLQGDATNLAQGWSLASATPSGDYGPAAFDDRGQLWLGLGDRYVVFDGGAWSSPPSPGLQALADLTPDGPMMSFVTRGGHVATCAAPGQCTTRLTQPAPLRAASSVGGVLYAAGDFGAMLRLGADGGLWNISGQHSVELTGLAPHADGDGWATGLQGASGELWRRRAGVWSPAQQWPSRLLSLAEVGGVLHVASEDGMLQLAQGSLRQSLMHGRDGGELRGAMIAVRADDDGGALAVGMLGAVYRLASSTTWDVVHPDDGTTQCRWAGHFDAGGLACNLGAVLPLGGGEFIAVGNLADNSGLVLHAHADGGVDVTRTATVRAGVTRLADGGVFVCGWDAEILVGPPGALTRAQLVGLPEGCTSVARLGETLLLTNLGGVTEVTFDDFDSRWHAGTVRRAPPMGTVTVLGDDVFAGGDESTIVRFRLDGG